MSVAWDVICIASCIEHLLIHNCVTYGMKKCASHMAKSAPRMANNASFVPKCVCLSQNVHYRCQNMHYRCQNMRLTWRNKWQMAKSVRHTWRNGLKPFQRPTTAWPNRPWEATPPYKAWYIAGLCSAEARTTRTWRGTPPPKYAGIVSASAPRQGCDHPPSKPKYETILTTTKRNVNLASKKKTELDDNYWERRCLD